MKSATVATLNPRIGLCLRFDESLGEPAALAGRIGYTRLLEILLAHPRMKSNILLSGTLLDAWCWFDSRPLELVRLGLERGQFSLAGSTYAQNLMPACEDWDNRRQMELHRETLWRLFAVAPTVFVCPDGAWQARLAPVISDLGYRTVPLEESILRAAGAQEPRAYRFGDSGLKILWNDEALRAQLAFASWFHDAALWRENLRRRKAADPQAASFMAIAEDADVFCRWGYRNGFDPRADLLGWEKALEGVLEEGCAFDFLENAPAPEASLAALPDGWNPRLDRMLADADWPEHEDGYSGWEDFRARAPKIAHFRHMHAAIRTKIITVAQTLGAADGNRPCDRFLQMAVRSYCTHQYRFGRPGSGGRGNPAWEGIGSALMLAFAAERAAFPQAAPQVVIDDVTGDGEDEVLLRQGDRLAVLSPCGGRMLGWFDLAQTRMHVGNPFAMPLGSLLMESLPVTPAESTDDWLPDESGIGEPVRDGRGELRLRYLDCDVERKNGDALPVWPRPIWFGPRPALPGRRRAFNDFLTIDDGPEEQSEHRLDFRVEEGGVAFLRFFRYRVELIKRICLTASGVRVTYRFRNVTSQAHRVRMRLVSELCPDGQEVGAVPGRILAPAYFGSRKHPGILNTRTGLALVCRASRPVSAPIIFQPAVLAWEVEQSFDFNIEPGKSQWLIVRLNILQPSQPMQPVLMA
jgi:hypothetical protein